MDAELYFQEDSKLTISKLNANAFNGQAYCEAFHVELPLTQLGPQAYNAQFDLKLDNVQLQNIIELAENPRIQGQGTLSGFLPIVMTEKDTQIIEGKIHNTNAGYIRYLPEQETKQSLKQHSQMDLLMKVLTHLNYHTLESDINLNKDGTLLLNGKVQGVNPDFKNGYPINFNPNIELDFQDMLRSLQIGDNLDRSIKKTHKPEKTLTD